MSNQCKVYLLLLLKFRGNKPSVALFSYKIVIRTIFCFFDSYPSPYDNYFSVFSFEILAFLNASILNETTVEQNKRNKKLLFFLYLFAEEGTSIAKTAKFKGIFPIVAAGTPCIFTYENIHLWGK